VFKKPIAIAVPTLAAAALVAAGLGGGASQATDSDRAPLPKAAKKAVVITKCDGGAQKRSWDRGVGGGVYNTAGTGETTVPGSTISFKGPKKGKDVLSVDLAAQAYLSAGYGQVKVLLDGIPMKPSDNVEGNYHFAPAGQYADFSRNYCRKVGKGTHTLTVTIRNQAAAGNVFYLFDEMYHAELSN
jgi:hypothetical protein